MITVNKGTDLIFELNFGELKMEDINSIKAVYYTENSAKVECTLENGKVYPKDECIYTKLYTEDTLDFNGVVRCDIEVDYLNIDFPDGGQLVSKTMYCDVNFK